MNDKRNQVDRRLLSERRAQEERRERPERRITNDRRIQGDRRKQCIGGQSGRKGLDTYKKFSQNQKRDELIKKHLKLVNFIVARLSIGLPNWIDKRDLINTGVIGLIDAVNNFDPTKGVKFETYASTRVRGAIIDELRALDWIPRSTRAKSKEIEGAISTLVNKLGRLPTDEEIAVELDWDMDKYYKALDQVSGTTLLSLDEQVELTGGGEPVKRIDTLVSGNESALQSIERKELISNVARILGTLPEQERLAIALYYYEELTLKEIGMVMNVSESRVSQIHTSAILKLRVKLRTQYYGA
ncbi:FliA/WhiG family RNA polymerase sigma factor [bacterium]|nr:FliA/WhiG family RNA polymerase sigma factor [bacterium]